LPTCLPTFCFAGGATHYLPGQGSEVEVPVAVRPTRGCASIHRSLTVLHAGGRIDAGTKYIMQFSLMYDAPVGAREARAMATPLRWGA